MAPWIEQLDGLLDGGGDGGIAELGGAVARGLDALLEVAGADHSLPGDWKAKRRSVSKARTRLATSTRSSARWAWAVEPGP